MYKVKLIACLLCVGVLALAMVPAVGYAAADKASPAVDAKGPFEGGRVMNARDKSNCKLALRLAARVQRMKGQITREELANVLYVTDNKDAWNMATEHVQDMVLEQTYQGKAVKVGEPGGWLKWLMENLPAILQMISTIIGLFSQDMPVMTPAYVDAPMPEADFMFCSYTPDACYDVACPVSVPGKAPSVATAGVCGPCAAGGPLRAAGAAVARGVARVATAPARVWVNSRHRRMERGGWYAGKWAFGRCR